MTDTIKKKRTFKGVVYDPCSRKFQASIIVDGGTKLLGLHPSEIHAALAVAAAVKKYGHRDIS